MNSVNTIISQDMQVITPGLSVAASSLEAVTSLIVAIVAASLDELPALVPDWRQMRKSDNVISPFADPDRYRAAMLGMADATPHVVVFRDADQPRALLVGRIERRQVKCRFGYAALNTPPLRCLVLEYGGVVATNGDSVAVKAMCAHLREIICAGKVDLVVVNRLGMECEVMHMLRSHRVGGIVTGSVEEHWEFELSHSYEATLQRFSKKHRYNIRRADNLLCKHFGSDVMLKVFERTDQVDEFVKAAAAIASRTYQGAMGVGFADTPIWRGILCAEAEHGRLRCYLMICAGEPIAFHAGCVYNGTYYLEAIGYAPEHQELSPGSVLLLRVFRDLAEQAIRKVNYGFGHADYKRIYGTRSWQEVTVHLYANRMRPRLAYFIERTTRAVTGIATSLIRTIGGGSTIRRAWRRRMAQPES